MYDCQKHKGGIIKTLQQIFINKLKQNVHEPSKIGTKKTKLAKMLQGGGGVSGGW